MKKPSDGKRVALFPGSFDPFTVGHQSIVDRALNLFDEVIIGIGVNSMKHSLLDIDARIAFIKSAYANQPRVSVTAYSELTADVAKKCGATCILRGVRMIQDFEYEKNLAELNRELSGIDTVLLYTLPEHGHISSTVVRELISYGHDVTEYLPSNCDLSLIPSIKKK